MRLVRRRGPRVPRPAVWVIGALIALLCLIVTGPGAIGSMRSATPSAAQVALAAELHDLGGLGHGNDKVVAVGTNDLRLTFRGHAQVAPFSGASATTNNLALAVGSCTGCLNFAVALQLILISPQTANVNTTAKADAISVDCVRCTTVAISIVYEIVASHPEQVARQVQAAVDRADDQLEDMSGWSKTPLATVARNLNKAIQQFTKAVAQAISDSLSATPGAHPNTQAPRLGAPPANTTLPGGLQMVPSLPGSPQVDIKIAS